MEKKECAPDSLCANPDSTKKRRKLLSAVSAFALIFVFSPAILDAISDTKNAASTGTGTVTTLYVEGMTCGGCELGVRKALERAGLKENEILSVDHSKPDASKQIGSAILKLPEGANKVLFCKLIREIKNSPGYTAYWKFDDKDPCKLGNQGG